MKESTIRGEKVQAVLYNTFSGNTATSYGQIKEHTAKEEYIAHQQNNEHPNLTVETCGLYFQT